MILQLTQSWVQLPAQRAGESSCLYWFNRSAASLPPPQLSMSLFLLLNGPCDVQLQSNHPVSIIRNARARQSKSKQPPIDLQAVACHSATPEAKELDGV